MNVTDTTKHYRTRAGEKVTVHEIVLKNAVGENVTFPVKCSILAQRKGARSRYAILRLDGKASIFGDHHDDVIGYWEH